MDPTKNKAMGEWFWFVYFNSQFGPQREGGYPTRDEAESLQKKMARRGRKDTRIVQEPL